MNLIWRDEIGLRYLHVIVAANNNGWCVYGGIAGFVQGVLSPMPGLSHALPPGNDAGQSEVENHLDHGYDRAADPERELA